MRAGQPVRFQRVRRTGLHSGRGSANGDVHNPGRSRREICKDFAIRQKEGPHITHIRGLVCSFYACSDCHFIFALGLSSCGWQRTLWRHLGTKTIWLATRTKDQCPPASGGWKTGKKERPSFLVSHVSHCNGKLHNGHGAGPKIIVDRKKVTLNPVT
jgi:hypothetical protein